jgi:histone H3/H4
MAILRDNIHTVSKAALKRLCQKAQCSNFDAHVEPELHFIILVFTVRLVHAIPNDKRLTGEAVAKAVKSVFGMKVNAVNEVEACPAAPSGVDVLEYYKTTAGVQIAKAVATRILKEVSQNLDKEWQYAKDAAPTYQIALEEYLVQVIGKAVKVMTKAKRKKLATSDLAEVNGYTADDDLTSITGIAYTEK